MKFKTIETVTPTDLLMQKKIHTSSGELSKRCYWLLPNDDGNANLCGKCLWSKEARRDI